jgi:hypothetical protein
MVVPLASGWVKAATGRSLHLHRVRARSIQPGDIVLVNRRGRMFHAKVRGEAPDGAFVVEPIERGISYRHVRSREIVDHWPHRRERGGEEPPAAQWSFDDLLDGRA